MREILYRGKGDTRFNSGGWVYGVPIKDYEGDWQLCTDCTKITVLPETIGEYTGLTDKNGKKIFEGDIVESPNGTRGVVEWHRETCAFLVNIGDDWQTMDDCPYEVVGNIYDKGEEK